MMKYYLINHTSRAAAYGIGSYCRYVRQCLKEIPDVEPVLIDISADVDEFSVTETDGIEHMMIPLNNNSSGGELYAHAIVSLLTEFLPTDEHCVFHFNYFQHYDLARLLKSRYPHCQLVFAIHYFSWCFALNGNITRFRNIVHENEIVEEKDWGVLQDYRNDSRFFALCDKVIALSSSTANLLSTDYGVAPEKVCLIYNGMDTRELTVDFHYHAEKKRKDILFVGRLDNIKGIDYIIKAFRLLLERGTDAHLTLVGDGNFNQYLSLCDGIWNRVTFTGKITKTQLSELYRSATIAVQPSFHEQCSYSAIEMMGHGIPLIATDTTGLGEMMDYTPECMICINETDFIDNRFVEELCNKMIVLLDNVEMRCHISKKQKRLFYKRHTLDCMQKSMFDLCAIMSIMDTSLSDAFYSYLDSKMIDIINAYLNIDFGFKGIAGIGCYMWFRICELNRDNGKNAIFTSYMLQENLIYYVDWIYDLLNKEDNYNSILKDGSILYILYQLLESGFYKTRIQSIIDMLPTTLYMEYKEKFAITVKGNNRTIINNALNIYNTYFYL